MFINTIIWAVCCANIESSDCNFRNWEPVCLENVIAVHKGKIANSNDTKHKIFQQTNGCQAGTLCTTVLGDIWLCCKR